MSTMSIRKQPQVFKHRDRFKQGLHEASILWQLKIVDKPEEDMASSTHDAETRGKADG